MTAFAISEPLVRKLLGTVDAGLVAGVGVPEPGKMCVEAAISYALGEPHSDGPSCVDAAVRAGKIALNDADWSSPAARAHGMRAVAIAQLGSKGTIDPVKYATRLAELTIREIVPLALRAAARLNPDFSAQLEAAAVRCATEGTEAAARAASAASEAASEAAARAARAARAASEAASEAVLAHSARLMVQALRECGSPGCDWLWLVEEVKP